MRRIAFVFALVAVGFVGGAFAGKKAAKKEIVNWSMADLKWQPVPNMQVMVAEAWKASNGSQCAFHKFPKGFTAPLHTHSKDLGGVVLAGSFGSGEEGTAEKLSGPGGYQFIPGGLKHTTKCGPDAECVVFACQPGPFDSKPAGEAKKK